jgi:hypothetical protein
MAWSTRSNRKASKKPRPDSLRFFLVGLWKRNLQEQTANRANWDNGQPGSSRFPETSIAADSVGVRLHKCVENALGQRFITCGPGTPGGL